MQAMMENGRLQPAWPQDLHSSSVLLKGKKRIILQIPGRDFMYDKYSQETEWASSSYNLKVSLPGSIC